MLELDKTKWSQLRASSGSNGLVALEILKKFYLGENLDYDELTQQICHQSTVPEVAYAVVPHLVAISKHLSSKERVIPLGIIGSVLAGMQVYPNSSHPIPTNLKEDFEEAQRETLQLALDLLAQWDWLPNESLMLLGVVSTLHKHGDLAMFTFQADHSGKLFCPDCGKTIEF